MQKIILAAALTLASSAFASTCEVEMRDNRSGRLIKVIRSYEYDDSCREAMKQCRLEIRTSGRYGSADCLMIRDNTPNPYPTPQPQPTPYPGLNDARRNIGINESVYYTDEIVTVSSINRQGQYNVRRGQYGIAVGVYRDELAVMNGCNLNLCVNEIVFNLVTSTYVTIEALNYNDRFVTRSTDGFNKVEWNVDRNPLAKTTGCVQTRRAQVCVNNQVIDTRNVYSRVIGIQASGLVVLESTDGWNRITPYVDPSSLVVTGIVRR